MDVIKGVWNNLYDFGGYKEELKLHILDSYVSKSYSITTSRYRNERNRGEIHGITFNNPNDKSISFEFDPENFSNYSFELVYSNSKNQEPVTPIATHVVDIVRVRPNIAFRVYDTENYIIRRGSTNESPPLTHINIGSKTIDLRALFLTKTDFNADFSLDEYVNPFEINNECAYIIS